MPDAIKVMTEEFTGHERNVFKALLEPGMSADTVIPDGMDWDKLWDYFKVAAKVFKAMDIASIKLRPLLGRMLLLIQANPAFYTEKGYTNWAHFLREMVEEKLGVGRQTAYDAMHIAAAFPAITPERAAIIGPVKLLLASRFTDASKPSCDKHLAKAETLSVTDFREYAETKGGMNHGEATPAVVIIRTSLEIKHVIEMFLAHPNSAGMCGTSDRGQILLHAIEEVSGEWGVDLA